MTLREELIQVAAVAVAIVQDLDMGTTDPEAEGGDGFWEGQPLARVTSDVEEERFAQERKWGPRHHTPEEWLAILAEEVGEAAGETTVDSLLGGTVQNTLLAAEILARNFLKERFGPDPEVTA